MDLEPKASATRAGAEAPAESTRTDGTILEAIKNGVTTWDNWRNSSASLRPLMEVEPMDRVTLMLQHNGRSLQEDRLRVPLDLLIHLLSFLPPAQNYYYLKDTAAVPAPNCGWPAVGKLMQTSTVMWMLVAHNDWVLKPDDGTVPVPARYTPALDEDLPVLVRALSHPSNINTNSGGVAEVGGGPMLAAVHLLQSLISDATSRDVILAADPIPPLEAFLSSEELRPKEDRLAVLDLIQSLSRRKPLPSLDHFTGVIPIIASMLSCGSVDLEEQVRAAWIVGYFCDGSNDRIQTVQGAGVVPPLVKLLQSEDSELVLPAIRAIGNMVTGTDQQTQRVIDAGALPALVRLLQRDQRRTIRKEVCWTVSNITAGSKEQIQSVLDADLLPALMEAMNHTEFEVRKEAVWAIANMTSGGSSEQILTLVEGKALDSLAEMLGLYDAKIVSVALEGIDNILDVGERVKAEAGLDSNPYADRLEANGGLESIEALQNHSNIDIFNHVQVILDAYFIEHADAPEEAGENDYTF